MIYKPKKFKKILSLKSLVQTEVPKNKIKKSRITTIPIPVQSDQREKESPIPVQSDQREKESRDSDQIGERELSLGRALLGSRAAWVSHGLGCARCEAWVSRWVVHGGGLPGSRTVVVVGSLVSQ